MMKKQIVGLGHAVTDLIAKTSIGLVADFGLEYGGMKLISHDEANHILKTFPPHEKTHGGSTANTLYHLGTLGHSVEFVCGIGDDRFGHDFAKDFDSIGISIDPACVQPDSASHFSIICVTPDSERSMGTFINESLPIECHMLPNSTIKNCDYLYLESYLWSHDISKKSALEATHLIDPRRGKVLITLSDQNCVKMHHEDLFPFVIDHCHYVFANHEEICALMQTSHIDEAKKKCHNHPHIIWIITEGRHGASIISGSQQIHIPAISVPKVVDKTGAGDLFAAGFIHGLINNLPLTLCGNSASQTASEVIQTIGARVQKSVPFKSNQE